MNAAKISEFSVYKTCVNLSRYYILTEYHGFFNFSTYILSMKWFH